MKSLGIDWGHRELCFAILDQERGWIAQERWEADRVPQLLERFAQLGGPSELRVQIESGSALLRETLRAHGYGVEEVAPDRAAQLAKLHFPGGAKDDARDARTLALAGLHRALGLTASGVRSEQAEALRLCTATRQRLVQHRTRVLQQLIDLLRRAHPGLARLRLDLRTHYALRLITAYPDPRSARRARRCRIQRILDEGRCRKLDTDTVWKSLREHGHVVADHVVEACALEAPLLVQHIEMLGRHIRIAEKHAAELSAHHPDRGVLESVPGIGVRLFPCIAARIDGQTSTAAGVSKLRILAGTAPRTRISGKRHGGLVLRRTACDHDLHQALIQMARCSLATSAWARAFVLHHTAGHMRDRKRVNKALRALANKWIAILCHLLRTRQAYDEERHCENLRRNRVAWAPPAPTTAA